MKTTYTLLPFCPTVGFELPQQYGVESYLSSSSKLELEPEMENSQSNQQARGGDSSPVRPCIWLGLGPLSAAEEIDGKSFSSDPPDDFFSVFCWVVGKDKRPDGGCSCGLIDVFLFLVAFHGMWR